ncbi:hypothetical protein RRG08_047448 [Elysia crispata]|uniref:Uncharacterized protein n=1 Tax=Elysia crispata TaxID=231223 RepID=A0AAE0YVY5_9GAST|nr:hypothetical protein RRG08_047448 [Elysia crispata]
MYQNSCSCSKFSGIFYNKWKIVQCLRAAQGKGHICFSLFLVSIASLYSTDLGPCNHPSIQYDESSSKMQATSPWLDRTRRVCVMNLLLCVKA